MPAAPFIPILAAAVPLLVWLYLLFGRGFFWSVKRNLAPAAGDCPARRLAVVIPARNEAGVIGRAVASLLLQNFSGEIRIFVVDDASEDGTASAALAAATSVNAADRLTVLQAPALPSGWTGKLWAVSHGIGEALKTQPDFLLLTDADIEHAEGNLTQLVALAESGSFDLTSFMVKLPVDSFAEKLLIPAFVFFFFQLYPPRWIADPRSRTAGAAGGCMLLRPAALERAGGIAAIRAEIIDDCALARAVKRTGDRVSLSLTTSARSNRPYEGFAEIGGMISRNAFNQLRHSTPLLTGAVLGICVTFLLPVLLVISGNSLLAAEGALAWALMTLAYLPMVRFYGCGILWAPVLPLAALVYLGATIHSAVQFWRGRGGSWKGRAQDARAGVHENS